MVFTRLFIPKINVYRSVPLHIAQAGAIAKALKSFHLKAAKKVELKFDPFHPNVSSIRDFLFYTSADKYRQTNGKCIFKTEICSDRSEPLIQVTLENQKFIFKTENLSVIELLQLFNKHVSSLCKPEEVSAPIKAKSSNFKTKYIRK